MPQRILVVEDDAPFCRLTCEALQRRAEFEICEPADGFEALQKADELQPDWFLLDIDVPDRHGFEVAARIGSRAPHARLLLMGQPSSSDIVRHGLSFGGHGYMHMQHGGTGLLRAFDAVLDGQRFVSSSVAFSDLIAHPTQPSVVLPVTPWNMRCV